MKSANDKDIREQVNTVRHMPGQQLDKAAAWNKLQLRMDKPSPAINARKTYSWLAAAILLLCISIGVWITSTTKKQPNNTAVVQKIKQEHAQAIQPAIAPPPANHTKPKHNTKLAVAATKHIITAPAIVKDVLPPVNPAPYIKEEQPQKTIPIQPVAIAKQVKVVHINDIFDAPQPVMAQRQERLFDMLAPSNMKTSVAVNHGDNIHFPKRFKNNLEN